MVGSVGEVPWPIQQSASLGAFWCLWHGLANSEGWKPGAVAAGSLHCSWRKGAEDSQMCSVFALVFASVFGLCWYQAFAPVVAGTDGRQIAIAWRDDQRKGNCRRGVEESRCRAAVAAIAAIAYGEYRLSLFTRLRAAALGTSGVRGAEMVRSSES